MISAILKKTPARLAVTEFLNMSKEPVGIGQIINYLKKQKLNTNKVTVYRIIDHFYKSGIVNRLEFGEGKFRYEIKKSHHHHLICLRCGRIGDVEGDFTKKMEKEIFRTKKFQIEYHSLEFFGFCENCQSNIN